MFHVANTFTHSKISKLRTPKSPYKVQNSFSVPTSKYNRLNTFNNQKQQRFFSTEEKKPEDEKTEQEKLEERKKITAVEQPSEEAKKLNDLYRNMKRETSPHPAEGFLDHIEETKDKFRKAQWEYNAGIKKEKKEETEENSVTEKLRRKKSTGKRKKLNSTDHLLAGEYNTPDPFEGRRTPDGKLLDDLGKEIPTNKLGYPIPPTYAELDTQDLGELSAIAKRRIMRLDDERHERNIRELRLRALQVSTAMGMQGAQYRLDSLPVEELKKVWNYVRSPHPETERPISTVVFNYNAGEIDASLYKTGDPLIVFFRKTRFFRNHPEQKYVYLASLFAIGVAIAIGIALLDAFTMDHSDQEDKNKTYVRARLVSTLGYTTAGAGATLLFTRLFASSLLQTRRLDLVAASFCALPLYFLFYTGTKLNYPEDSSVGKLAIAAGLSASVGLGIASHSLKKGTGFVRLLVPVLFSTTFLSTSLAISPFNVNLEYGVPLGVLCATLAGMFGASAIFPPYRSKTRAVLGSTFALTYAGLLLSYTQPYLNNIKFADRYYGVDTYGNDTNLLLKSFFFIPLKAVDIIADQTSKRDLFK